MNQVSKCQYKLNTNQLQAFKLLLRLHNSIQRMSSLIDLFDRLNPTNPSIIMQIFDKISFDLMLNIISNLRRIENFTLQ